MLAGDSMEDTGTCAAYVHVRALSHTGLCDGRKGVLSRDVSRQLQRVVAPAPLLVEASHRLSSHTLETFEKCITMVARSGVTTDPKIQH